MRLAPEGGQCWGGTAGEAQSRAVALALALALELLSGSRGVSVVKNCAGRGAVSALLLLVFTGQGPHLHTATLPGGSSRGAVRVMRTGVPPKALPARGAVLATTASCAMPRAAAAVQSVPLLVDTCRAAVGGRGGRGGVGHSTSSSLSHSPGAVKVRAEGAAAGALADLLCTTAHCTLQRYTSRKGPPRTTTEAGARACTVGGKREVMARGAWGKKSDPPAPSPSAPPPGQSAPPVLDRLSAAGRPAGRVAGTVRVRVVGESTLTSAGSQRTPLKAAARPGRNPRPCTVTALPAPAGPWEGLMEYTLGLGT